MWHALILFAVLSALGVGFYHYEKQHRLALIDKELDLQVHILAGPLMHPERTQRDPERRPVRKGTLETGAYPGGWTRSQRVSVAENRERDDAFDSGIAMNHLNFEAQLVPAGYYAFVETRSLPPRKYRSSNFPDLAIPDDLPKGFFVRLRDGRYRELYHQTRMFRVLIGVDLNYYQQGLARLKLQILAVLTAVFLLPLGIGTILVSRSLGPLRQIEETANDIASARLSARIPDSKPGDATELKSLQLHLNQSFERLESLFEKQIRFTADASHELRTPLTALVSQIEYGLKRERSPEDYTRILEVCARSTYRIQRITEQLIELARYDSGRATMDYESISLASMLTSLAEELQPYVQKNGSELQTDLQDADIECDPFKLEQVVTNLVNNAIQHNDRPVTLTICAREHADAFTIDIIDNGKGIAPEHIDHLFDRFYQESTSRTKQTTSHNVGLGLAISAAIIKSHGGILTAKSQPDLETIFTIKLPRHPVRGSSVEVCP